MILTDRQIRALCLEQQMVTPFQEHLLNPASLDILLGDKLMVERPSSPELLELDISQTTEQEPYLLRPSNFVLAQSIETFNMPDDVCGQALLKSSRAREGIDHALALWLDPGWHGSVLTLELRNNRHIHPVRLWRGMKIAQVIFHKLGENVERSYRETGRYNLDTQVTGSKG